MYKPSAGKLVSNEATLNPYFQNIKIHKNAQSKYSTPKTSNFSLDALIPALPSKSSKQLFNFIIFEEKAKTPVQRYQPNTIKPTTPVHRRQPSIMIHNISEIYSFTQNNESFYSINEEESRTNAVFIIKNSVFASTADQVSPCNSYRKKSCSEVEEAYYESDNTETAETYNGITKPDESFKDLCAQKDELDNENKKTENKGFCLTCNGKLEKKGSANKQVLSFWKTLCCFRNGADNFDFDKSENNQGSDYCRNCQIIVTKQDT